MKRTNIFNFIKYISLIFSIISLAACTTENDQVAPLIEVKAPDFSLTSLSGSNLNLSDFQDKVVVLFFFGNNCPSCKAAAPDVEAMLYAPFASRNDYQILGLDQWNGNSASVQAFKTVTGVSFPLLLNAASVAANYKTTYDRLVVIDKNGNIVHSGTKGVANDISEVKQKVEMLLGSSTNPPLGMGTKAPDFSLTSLSGQEVKLNDYKDKVVVLFFFGNNCPSCKAVAPNVESMLLTPFSARTDYQLLGLDQWNGNANSVEAFKTVTGVTFPLLLNASGVASAYSITYDRLVVIDKSGNIAFSGTKTASGDMASVKQKVQSLLQ